MFLLSLLLSALLFAEPKCPFVKIAPPTWTSKTTKRVEKVKKWQERWLNKAESWLEKNGTEYKRISKVNKNYIEILPAEDGSALNQLLFELKKKRPTLKFVFSPRKLLRAKTDEETGEKFYKMANASYNSKKTSVRLPVDSVQSGEVADSVHHEILHGVFDYFREEGIDSAFNGRFTAVEKGTPLWNSPTYDKHLSIEEFATHSLNLRLLSIKMEQLLKNPSYDKAQMTELVEAARKRASNMAGFAEPALKTLKSIQKSLTQNDNKVKVEWSQPSEEHPYYVATFTTGNIKYRMPLPTLTSRTKVADRKAEVLRKLGMQIIIVKGVLKVCNEIGEARKPNTKAQLQAFTDLLNAPRDLTLEYITLN